MEFNFEKLTVWQKSRQLVKVVYDMLKQFPDEERYALCDQIRRAIVSVPSNLAEGSGRDTHNDQIRFIEYSYGSLMEALCQLILAQDLGYITEENLGNVKPLFHEVARMLSGLKRSLK